MQNPDPKEILLWLSCNYKLTFSRYKFLIQVYPDLLTGYQDSFQKLDLQKNSWLKPIVNNLGLINSELAKIRDELAKWNVSFFTFFDEFYPKSLGDLHSPPLVLFYQGEIDCLQAQDTLTVVGSRDITHYAKVSIKNLLNPIISSGVVIVSGLATGVDGFCHQMSVEKKARTIGVIGSGLDDKKFYPQANLNLKKIILDNGGLVISEYMIGTEATRFSFPARNRILAALSEVTIVFQAGHKSGSLITAEIALEQGKTVATIPANLGENKFLGNLELIKNGASLITSSQDIYELLGAERVIQKNVQDKINFSSNLEEKIYAKLSLSGQNIEEIAQSLDLTMNDLQMHLTMLEINGLASNLGENIWAKGQ